MNDDDALAVAARIALLDHAAATAVRHLAAGDVRALLVKGPSIARWLYDEDEQRGYVDVDLLVSPTQTDEAVRLLRELGYTPVFDEAAPTERGVGWQNEQTLRGEYGVEVDLHHRLIGVPSAERCWELLSDRTAPMSLGPHTVEVLGLDARTLHLALHAAQNGAQDRQALEDLRRGVTRLPAQLWRDAAALAQQLACTPAFAAGLRLLPEGRPLAQRLRLAYDVDVEVAVRVEGGSQDALFFERLRAAGSWRERVGTITRELFPTAAFLRAASPLAARGRTGLALARVWRVVSILGRLPGALSTWARARRKASGGG